jgi:hypothetical protein
MTKEKREALEYLLRMVEGSLADQGQFKAIRAMLSEEPPHADAASLDSPSARAALAGIELARRAHADAIRRDVTHKSDTGARMFICRCGMVTEIEPSPTADAIRRLKAVEAGLRWGKGPESSLELIEEAMVAKTDNGLADELAGVIRLLEEGK